jgi:L-arabinokinase
MGKRMAEAAVGHKVAHVTEFSPSAVLRDVLPRLPTTITGAEFTTRYGSVDDPLSVVEPSRTYDVAAALRFPAEENFRCGVALSLLKAAAGAAAPAALLRQVGELMQQTHVGYTSIGLGSAETDEMVRKLAALEPAAGVYGARVSGGGSGGTVVVLCERSALPLLERIATETTFGTPFTGFIQ